MKRFLLLLLFASFAVIACAQLPYKVVLRDGTVLRGRISESSNDSCVMIKTLDGTLHSCELREVVELGKTPRSEVNQLLCDRPFGFFIRPELGVGLGCSASLTMGLQINPYYAVFFGGGVSNSSDISMHFGMLVVHDMLYDMVIVGNRAYFCKGKNAPFFDFRLGFARDRYKGEEGPFGGGMGLGYAIGSFDVGCYLDATFGNPLEYYSWEYGFIGVKIAYSLRNSL
jgi:hypothetical protein